MAPERYSKCLKPPWALRDGGRSHGVSSAGHRPTEGNMESYKSHSQNSIKKLKDSLNRFVFYGCLRSFCGVGKPQLLSFLVSSGLEHCINIVETACAMVQKFTKSKTIHCFSESICQLSSAVDPVGPNAALNVILDDQGFYESSMFLTLRCRVLHDHIIQRLAVYYGYTRSCQLPHLFGLLPWDEGIADPLPQQTIPIEKSYSC